MGDFLTMTEAAERIGVKRQYIHQLIQSDRLHAIWMLGRWAVPRSEVKRIKQLRRQATKSTNGNGNHK